jgi:hypothetical protein
MTGNYAEFLLSMSKLARATITAFPDFIPVTAHLGLVEGVGLLI